MRKGLLTGLLGVAVVAASMFPPMNSDAARAPQGGGISKNQAQRAGLPNYDIRLAGRGEFTDVDVSPVAGARRAVPNAGAAVQSRAAAVENFRAGLRPEHARNLRAEVNEAGALKNLFIDGAALSEPQWGGPDQIVNPGFETGTTPWVIASQVTRSTGAYPHSGVAYMLINGVNNTSGTLSQMVTIPASGANLNFWLNITTSEAAGAAVFDRLFIEVRNTAGTLLGTLATFSNQNSGTAGVYALRGPYNLNSWAGQTVRIQFRGTNDITLPTSFRIDDVSVK